MVVVYINIRARDNIGVCGLYLYVAVMNVHIRGLSSQRRGAQIQNHQQCCRAELQPKGIQYPLYKLLLGLTGTAHSLACHALLLVTCTKGGSRGVSKVSRNWSDHLWLVFACISLIMSMLPYSYTFMCWKPVIKVFQSALVYRCSIVCN